MDGNNTTETTTNDSSRSRLRSVLAGLASLWWLCIGLCAISILAFLVGGGLPLVIAGQ